MSDITNNPQQGKGDGTMQRPPSLLAAVRSMDLILVEECLDTYPDSIMQLDSYNNNAMHLCAAGGSERVEDIVKVLLARGIDLNHKNSRGDTPIDIAIAMNDEHLIGILWGPTLTQLRSASAKPLRPDVV